MLEIDYDLLPLSPEEETRIAKRGLALAKRGKIPAIPASDFGRVVVVNPNEGFSIHHVPDDLRRPLRRSKVTVFGGSRPLPLRKIWSQILDDEQEQIHHLVIELHSEFPGLSAFIAGLPHVRRHHPNCRMMIHGELEKVHALLGDLVGEKGWQCELLFDHFHGSIPIRKYHDLSGIVLGLPRYPTLRTSFFSHLMIQQEGSVEGYDLAGLKTLYRLFGVGHIEELDISGLLREKLITVDLPLTAIRGVIFREKRGETFLGVKTGGEKIPSARFLEKGLMGREVSFASLEAVYRTQPNGQEEEILLANVRALRVNCFDGHVSFLFKPNLSYVPLYEVRGMRLFPPTPQEGEGESFTDLKDADIRPFAIETMVVTEKEQPRFGDVRSAVRLQFLELLYREGLTRSVKLQRYASNLKVACLGPMGAQTLNLLKPLGLAKAVPSKTMFYLCDSLEQVPDFAQQRERMEQALRDIGTRIKELFGAQPADGLKHDAVTHRLPLLREWAQNGPPRMKKLTAEPLDAIYSELKVFATFCESEFRRMDLPPGTDMVPFSRLAETQELGLKVKHLAALVGERFGKIPGPEDFPDFVFFGSETDREKNGREFYLPGIALSQVLRTESSRDLFLKDDFGFTVFLEEQMALLAYARSQDPDGDPPDFRENYFQNKCRAAETELLALQKLLDLVSGRVEGSHEFHEKTVNALKAEHRTETESFREDSETETEKLQHNEAEYFEALASVQAELEKTGLLDSNFAAGEDYIRDLDTRLVHASRDWLKSLRTEVAGSALAATEVLKQKAGELAEYFKGFTDAQKALFLMLQAEYAGKMIAAYDEGRPGLLENLRRISTLREQEAQTTETNLGKRQEGAKSEFGDVEKRISEILAKSQRNIGNLRQETQVLGVELRKPLSGKAGEPAPHEILDAIAARLTLAEQKIQAFVQQGENAHKELEALRPLYTRKSELGLSLYQGENTLAVLAQRITTGGVKKPVQPQIPEPPIPRSDDLAALKQNLLTMRRGWEKYTKKLTGMDTNPPELQASRKSLVSYQTFEKEFNRFRSAVRKKMQGQRAVTNINSRLQLLEQEAVGLTEFVTNKLLPAQAKLAEQVYLPNTRKRLENLKKANQFLQDLEGVSFENLQKEFFTRGIFQRFFAKQFLKGAHFGLDLESPLFPELSNVVQGIILAQRLSRDSLVEQGYLENDIHFSKLPAEGTAGILDFLARQKALEPADRLNYLILPATLSLVQGVDLILAKEEMFGGLPQQVLIFISKFNNYQVTASASFRDRYFRALRHNVIVNVDGGKLVDNPKMIAEKLLQETVGCAHDFQSKQGSPMGRRGLDSGAP